MTSLDAALGRGLAGRDGRARALVFVGAFALYAATSVLVARAAAVPLGSLAVFFDGHLYLEIAKSFPLPYAPEAIDYAGHAPGFPASIYLARLLVPDALAGWGAVALAAVFAASAYATVVFYDVCRLLELPAAGGALVFAVANPEWLSLASTAHAEPLAMLFSLLALRAYLNDALPTCVAFLSLATLTRFPAILLGLPFAFGTLVRRDRRNVRTLLLLGVPIVSLLLLHLYLVARIPSFRGIWGAHSVFWAPAWIPPFAGLLAWAKPGLWRPFLFAMTYGTVLVYLASIAVGLVRRQGPRPMLALWVAAILVFHVSLANSAPHLVRLTLLAWPAALLLLSSALAPALRRARPRAAAGFLVACACAAAASAGAACALARGAVALQRDRGYIADEIRRLDTDTPRWVDFER